ncbi:MAG: hypothetical protein ACXVCE_03635, partial [Bacteriovorax sp.]
MKKFLFIFCMIFQFNSFAEEIDNVVAINPINEIQNKSAQLIGKTESCQDILTNHLAIVDESESFIGTLVSKKSEDITQYEILMLQKILTNRFVHLSKAMNAYVDKEEVKGCSPGILGEAIAIYDFTLLGSKALNDPKIRRIVYNFTKYPKYKLSELLKMYTYYTSSSVIEEFQEELNAEKVALPEQLSINKEINDGRFYTFSDALLNGSISVISGAARVWGFISDQLKWRNGHLNGNTEVLTTLEKNLRPLDLLYEKRE